MSKVDVNTLSIKAKFANKIRKQLYEKYLKSLDSHARAGLPEIEATFTLDQVGNMMVNIMDNLAEMHGELNDYRRKQKKRRIVNTERVARGYQPKPKTTLEQWKQMKLNENKTTVDVVNSRIGA